MIAAHSDQALAMLAEPARPSARSSARFPLPGKRSRPAHRYFGCCRAARRLVELELPLGAAPAAQHRHLWMNTCSGCAAMRQYLVTLNRPDAIDRHGAAPFHYEHPVTHPRRRRCPGAIAEISGRARTHTAALLGLGLPRGSGVVSALRACREIGPHHAQATGCPYRAKKSQAEEEAALAHDDLRRLRGLGPPPPLRVSVEHRFPVPALLLYRISTSCRASSTLPRWSPAPRARPLPPR